MISCSDSSRNVFIYKDSEGNINKDIKCKGCKQLRSQIEGKQNQNQIDITELRILENDETNYDSDCDFYDEKLVVAADDIKEMKKDSGKFSKSISELV